MGHHHHHHHHGGGLLIGGLIAAAAMSRSQPRTVMVAGPAAVQPAAVVVQQPQRPFVVQQQPQPAVVVKQPAAPVAPAPAAAAGGGGISRVPSTKEWRVTKDLNMLARGFRVQELDPIRKVLLNKDEHGRIRKELPLATIRTMEPMGTTRLDIHFNNGQRTYTLFFRDQNERTAFMTKTQAIINGTYVPSALLYANAGAVAGGIAPPPGYPGYVGVAPPPGYSGAPPPSGYSGAPPPYAPGYAVPGAAAPYPGGAPPPYAPAYGAAAPPPGYPAYGAPAPGYSL